MKLVKTLFVFLLFIFPLGVIGRVELGGGVNILLNDIVVFLTGVLWVVNKIVTRKSYESNTLAKPILFFAMSALFALVINQEWLTVQEIFVSSLYLIRWISYAGLYFIAHDFDNVYNVFKQKVLYGLVAAGTVTALIGLLQYLFYPDLRNLFYAGWDEHLYRLFSSLLDPNYTGGILVLTFLLATSMLLQEKLSLKRPRLMKLTYFFASATSFAGILLTYSRGSFISLLVGSLLLIILSNRKKLIALLVILFVFGVLLLPKNLQSEGVELLRTASIKQRIESSEHAIILFKDNPLLGVGFNAYRYAQVRYGFLTPLEAKTNHAGAGTDNSFLFVLATTGIIGFFAYCYLWWKIIRLSLGQKVVLASIAAIFVHALFVNSLFYPWIMEWMWILIAAVKVQK